MTPFKALAVMQPWAALIASGKKRIEIRSWLTHYRGPLVIVASSTREPSGYDLEQPTSCLMAVVDLVDVRPGRSSDTGAALSDPSDSFSWVLANARPLVHVRYTRSRQSTFNLEPDVDVRLATPDARGLRSEWTAEERATLTRPAKPAKKPPSPKPLDISWLVSVAEKRLAGLAPGSLLRLHFKAKAIVVHEGQELFLVGADGTIAGLAMPRNVEASRGGFDVECEVVWVPSRRRSAVKALEKARVPIALPDGGAIDRVALTRPETRSLRKALGA